MIKIKTFGGSHGESVGAFVKGLPAGHTVDISAIERELKKRREGIGRSERQKIERDKIIVLSGLTGGKTDGGEFGFKVENADNKLAEKPPITAVRPSHADLIGCKKYNLADARKIAEIAGGRSTLAHTAAGCVCRQILAGLGISTYAYSLNIGGVRTDKPFDFASMNGEAEKSPVRTFDHEAGQKMAEKILWAAKSGETLGGLVRAGAANLPAGIGDFRDYRDKLDSKIAAYLMAIPSVKGIEFGLGQKFADLTGSEANERLTLEGGEIAYLTNNSGGIIGGMSSGKDIWFTLTVKPLPSTAKPTPSFDIVTKKPADAFFERSDICVVPNVAVIAENMLATVILDAILADKKRAKELGLC